MATVPNHQATTAFVANAGAAATIAWPTHAVDDVAMVVVEASGNSAVIVVPAGWDLKADLRDVNTIAGSRFHVLLRRATSAAEGTINFPTQLDHKIYGMVTFRNVDPSVTMASITVATATKIPASASTTITFPTATAAAANSLAVMAGSRPDDSASTTHFSGYTSTSGAVTALTEILEAGDLTGNGGGLVIVTGTVAAAGATGTVTATKTASTSDTSVMLILPPIPDALRRRPPIRPRGNINNSRFY